MLSWLYDIFVAIVSFVMNLFGFDLKKRSVTFADEVEKKESVDSTAQVEPTAQLETDTQVESVTTVEATEAV